MKNLYTHILRQNNKSNDSATISLATFLVCQLLFICSVTILGNVVYAQTISSSHGRQSFATSIDGKSYAWGYNNSGQIGNNTTTNQFVPVNISSFGAINGKSIIRIGSGVQHTIALDNAGQVYAWGYNHVGQLGNGSTSTGSQTTAINVNIPANIVSIAAGGHHNLALDNAGKVYRWGFSGNGLGGGGSNPAIMNSLTNIKEIAAGLYHSMVLTEAGTVYAWGLNSYGQLGYSTTSSISNTPQLVPGLTNVIAIAAGQYHSMALTAEGEVYTWGRNSYGQLGNGSSGNSVTTPALVTLPGDVMTIAAGSFHSLALSIDGSTYAWGKGDVGQLGNGVVYTSATDYGNSTPVLVKTSSGDLANVYKIAGGVSHSLAYTCDGKVYSWGAGSVGELGNGSGTANTLSLLAKPISNFELRILDDIEVYTASDFTSPLATPLNIAGASIYTRALFTNEAGDIPPFSAEWNWGDGTTSFGIVDGNYIEGDHNYMEPGVYTVSLTVNTCKEYVETYNYVVVYDPNGSAVAGFGIFNSPPGAYKPNVSVTGQGILGISAQYLNGSTTPTGINGFTFIAGNINFVSSELEPMRLVVSGSEANYKGTGTIAGHPDEYQFLLAASDGDMIDGSTPDKLRIRIWNNNGVIYDNNLSNTDENAVPETAIEFGEILIFQPFARKSFEPAAAEGNISMNAYPNPFIDRLTVNLGRTYTEDFTVTLYSTQGSPVADKAVAVPESGISSIELQIPGLKDGLYILQVRSVQGSKAIKVLKK